MCAFIRRMCYAWGQEDNLWVFLLHYLSVGSPVAAQRKTKKNKPTTYVIGFFRFVARRRIGVRRTFAGQLLGRERAEKRRGEPLVQQLLKGDRIVLSVR